VCDRRSLLAEILYVVELVLIGIASSLDTRSRKRANGLGVLERWATIAGANADRGGKPRAEEDSRLAGVPARRTRVAEIGSAVVAHRSRRFPTSLTRRGRSGGGRGLGRG
jgi:hypothetical protein